MLLFTQNLSSSSVFTPVLAVAALSVSPNADAYTADTLIQLSASFTAIGTNTLIDPTSVTCRIEDPVGNIIDVSNYVQNPSLGVYTVTYTPLLRGVYRYEFIGSGSVQVAQIGRFTVNQVPF